MSARADVREPVAIVQAPDRHVVLDGRKEWAASCEAGRLEERVAAEEGNGDCRDVAEQDASGGSGALDAEDVLMKK